MAYMRNTYIMRQDPQHIVLVKGWIEKEGKYLMAQRALTEHFMPGAWSLPGGKVEHQVGRDILLDTLKKEVQEEVGVEINDKLDFVYDNCFVRNDGAFVVSLTFRCFYKSGDARPLEDTAQVKWFSIDELETFKDVEDFLQHEIDRLIRFLKK